ncbi:MAG: hypothetical protein FJY66_05635 [Calditrichaeota bacterium]|nr:hypothetical protein [Calditrichota bacterium]
MRTSYRLLQISLLLLGTAFLLGCSKDDNNPSNSSAPSDAYIWIFLEGDSTQIFFDDLPRIHVDGVEAIQLSEFIDTTLIPKFVARDSVRHDARPLYAYQVFGSDGFSASGSRGYRDNTWEHMTLGFLIVSTKGAIFPDELIDLPGAYNVRDVAKIVVHRKFDIAIADSVPFVELKDVTSVQITNDVGVLENALPLKDFVEELISNPADFQYNIRSLDDFGPTTDMTWAQFQTGYWLMESGKTFFTDTTLVGGRYKLKVLEKILVNPIVSL